MGSIDRLVEAIEHEEYDKINDISKQITASQKDEYVALNKYGKTLERFAADLGSVNRIGELDDAILLDMIRRGLFGVAETFMMEAGIDRPEMLDHYIQLYAILDQLDAGNIIPAVQWVESQPDLRGSDLELILHRYRFMELVRTGERQQAVQYAQIYLQPFVHHHLPQVQQLMYTLVMPRDPSMGCESPDPGPSLANVRSALICEFSAKAGFGGTSPMRIAVQAGALAMPVLLKVASIMRDKHTEWTSNNETPVEIPLPRAYRFHSVFVCPVSKEQATENNPAMRLPCGHCVCRDSLLGLSKGMSKKFKCPYCPELASESEAKRLYI